MYVHVCMFVTCMHEHTIWLDVVVLRISWVCILVVHICRIAVFEAENCPICEYCIMYAKSLLTQNALTQPEHLRNGCCCVML